MQNLLTKIFYRAGLIAIIGLTLISCKQKEQPILEEDFNAVSQEVIIDSLHNPTQPGSAMSRLFATQDKLYMSWLQRESDTTHLWLANYDGTTWSTPEHVSQGTDWFVNWADFTNVAVNNGAIFVHYLKKSAPDTYAYDVWFKVFNPQTQQWSNDIKLHSDTTQSEHGFVSVVPNNKDGFFAIWLDGRTTVDVPKEEAQMTVRGATIDSSGKISEVSQIDARVCDCCATSVTMGPDGPIAAYRDRSTEEIRDISVKRYINNEWTNPATGTADNWKIAGCPVNGPAIDSKGNSVAMAHFTNAADTSKVFVNFSLDKGASFDRKIRVDLFNPLGRVDLVMLDANTAVVLWMEALEDDAELYVRRVTSDGQKSDAIKVAQTSMERASGFPQLELFDDALMVSYTLKTKDVNGVETFKLPLTNF